LLAAACSSNESAASSPSDAGADSGSHKGDANDWSCLGTLSIRAPDSATMTVDFAIGSVIDSVPAANVSVRACPDRLDPTCAGGTASVITDQAGHALFDVAGGFDGYFEATETGDVTNLHYPSFPFYRAKDDHQRAEWRIGDLRLVADPIGFSFDPAKGQILVEAQDCRSSSLPGWVPPQPGNEIDPRAGGVTMRLEPMPAGVITAYGEQEPHARVRTDIDETADGYGGMGFLNVPPGVYTVTGIRKSTGERIGSQRIHVRAETFSMLILGPTP
jgi:hypothetical protein